VGQEKKAIHIVSADVALVCLHPSNFSIYLYYFCRYTVLYSLLRGMSLFVRALCGV